jgi:hypothetical protein
LIISHVIQTLHSCCMYHRDAPLSYVYAPLPA